MVAMPPLSRCGSDDFQTPPEAVRPLLPYLPPGIIWECACGKGNLADGLRQAGHNVIATDKKDGKDFLLWQPRRWHCIVTNPPFSKKNEFLARAYALGKPFAFLLPLTALESPSRQGLFQRNGIQVLLLDKRINFETPNQTLSHPWFPVAWFCSGLNLPEQLTFVDGEQRRSIRTKTINNGLVGEPFTLMSDVQTKPVQHLWNPYVPLGELTVIDGDPGVNKSSFTLDLAARVSTGAPMPGEKKKSPRGGVLLLVAEDSIRKTLPLRLQAAGADLTRIAVLQDTLTIPNDLGTIEAVACQMRARLLIIDPLMAFLGRDANSDQKVRQALMPLRALAERTNMAVILVRHLNKSGGRYSLYRGSGSIGIIGTTRSAMLIGIHPDDPNMRVLSHEKCNLSPEGPSLLFEPVSDDRGGVRIEWRGECDLKGKDLLKPSGGHKDKFDKARKFLLDALADGPVERNKLKQMAVETKIAWRTVERAKEVLSVISGRKGWGPGSKCCWEMPNDESEDEA
jgi:AAA domain